MQIHQLTIPHGGHTFLFRFTADRIGALRFHLALNADVGNFPYSLAFEANLRIQHLISRDSEMDELEHLKTQWVRDGFTLGLLGTSDGWHVTLWNSGITHRQPQGRGATLIEAMAAAECDRVGLLKAKKKV